MKEHSVSVLFGSIALKDQYLPVFLPNLEAPSNRKIVQKRVPPAQRPTWQQQFEKSSDFGDQIRDERFSLSSS